MYNEILEDVRRVGGKKSNLLCLHRPNRTQRYSQLLLMNHAKSAMECRSMPINYPAKHPYMWSISFS